MRRFVMLVDAEWRTARATVIAGIVFAAGFIAACDLTFTKGDPRYVGEVVLPVAVALVVCSIAADLLSRGQTGSTPPADASLPASAAFVFAARFAFLALVTILAGSVLIGTTWAWTEWLRSYGVPYSLWRSFGVPPLHWVAILPAAASVLLASSCGARGMIALIVGLGSSTGVVLTVKALGPANFGYAIDSSDAAWIAVSASCLFVAVAAWVFVRGLHRVVSSARRTSWAMGALLAVLAPAGVVLAGSIESRLNPEIGTLREFEILSLSPDQSHLVVLARGEAPQFAQQWLVEVQRGTARRLPGYSPTVTAEPEWLKGGLVRLPYTTIVWNGLKLDASVGTFDVESARLVSRDGPFDPEHCSIRGFTPDADASSDAWVGFGRTIPAGSLHVGDRAGTCIIRTSPECAEFYDFTVSPHPHARIDGLRLDDHLALLPRCRFVLVQSSDLARIVSFADGAEVARIPVSRAHAIWRPGSGSSDAYVWRYRNSTTTTWSVFHIETGVERVVHSGGASRLWEQRILDDGTVIEVVEPGILRRYQPDGTIVDTPLRLLEE